MGIDEFLGEDKMKNKNVCLFILMCVALIVFTGCNGQEKRDAADAERLAVIEEHIDALFNQEKTDIASDLAQEQIDKVEELLAEERENKFSPDNLKRIDSILLYLDLAIDMFAFDQEVDQLFDEEGGLVKDAEIETVESSIAFYETETVFYARQLDKIADAKEQLVAIEEVRKQVDSFFVDGEVRSDVSREDEAEMRELIATLKSMDAKRELEASLVKVATLLTGQERAVASAEQAYQEELEREREAEAAAEEETAKAAKVQTPKEPKNEAAETEPEEEEEPEESESDDANTENENETDTGNTGKEDEVKNEEVKNEDQTDGEVLDENGETT